jgi:hypothetical protein
MFVEDYPEHMAMTYETAQLRTACEADQSILNKLTEVRTRAPGYGTPGPSALDAHAKHAHLTNDTGIAWVYRGKNGADQHILALGRKDDKAKPNNSKYRWDKFGDI